jgi:chitin disaccharide deacetylase
MSAQPEIRPVLIVTADDYGYAPGYNRGILEVAKAGAVDAVSVMVGRRWCEPRPLLESEVEVGLHLELPGERPQAQLERFRHLFGRAPAFLDGHHHCHARGDAGAEIARLAAARGLPVRSVSPAHRGLLRQFGVGTPDRLIGRRRASEPELPALLAAQDPLPPGVTEWMVHPGYADARAESSYNAAREQDLNLLLRVSPGLAERAERRTHAAALVGSP